MSRWSEQDLANHQAKRALARGVTSTPILETVGRVYSFIVPGLAQPGGSKKAFALYDKKRTCHCGSIPGYVPLRRRNGSIIINVTPDNDAKHKKWRKQVERVAREEYSGPLFTGFLRVTWIFYQPRPQSHYTSTGKLSKQGLETPWPNVAPDVTKLVRAAEDALHGVVYANDAIIVKQKAEKEYGVPARVEITVEELLVTTPHEQPELFEAPMPWEK